MPRPDRAYCACVRSRCIIQHSELPGFTPVAARGPVAQRLEQSAHNRLIAGSNPAGPTHLPVTARFSLPSSFPMRPSTEFRGVQAWRRQSVRWGLREGAGRPTSRGLIVERQDCEGMADRNGGAGMSSPYRRAPDRCPWSRRIVQQVRGRRSCSMTAPQGRNA